MKRIIAVAVLAIATVVFAQSIYGIETVTVGTNPICRTFDHKAKYLVQANVTNQDYTYNLYSYSSAKVWLSPTYTTATQSVPQDGGYVNDGGTYFWEIKPPIVLKDTDTFTFNILAANTALCYKAGTMADGGASAMTLTISEITK